MGKNDKLIKDLSVRHKLLLFGLQWYQQAVILTAAPHRQHNLSQVLDL